MEQLIRIRSARCQKTLPTQQGHDCGSTLEYEYAAATPKACAAWVLKYAPQSLRIRPIPKNDELFGALDDRAETSVTMEELVHVRMSACLHIYSYIHSVHIFVYLYMHTNTHASCHKRHMI